jgi:alkylation response protein AidB-like acyl-CoA dehydrogenase
MDFSLSEDQSILADSVARFVDSEYDFETRQKIAASESGFSPEMWRTFAELGITAIPFAEEDGGLGGGSIELMLVMEQIGRGLVVEPFLANIVLAGGVLKRVASAEQKTKWLAPLIGGELQAALAFAEPQGRYDIADIATTAAASGDHFALSGSKNMVLNGGAADVVIVPARTSGDRKDMNGISLFAVPADADGVSRKAYPTVDGLQAAELELDNVTVPSGFLLGELDGGFGVLASTIDEATLAICAEAVGIMQTMHEKTVEYTKNRKQFGVPISTFQALQHRMVDTMIGCEQSRSLLYWAVMLAAADDPSTGRAISALKYQVGTAGTRVAREAVQLHGGMGVTWELDIAHYFKRMTAIDLMFGNADFHLDRYAGAPGS